MANKKHSRVGQSWRIYSSRADDYPKANTSRGLAYASQLGPKLKLKLELKLDLKEKRKNILSYEQVRRIKPGRWNHWGDKGE